MWGNFGYGWGFAFFPFLWIIFWVFIAFLFFGRWNRHGRYWQDHQSAEDILRERYAKGEINEKEYKERLEVLARHQK